MIELPRDVAVIGAGTMGAGIARVFADGGASVRLMARRETSLAAAQQRLGTGPVRLTTSLDEALRGADLVVETIVEDAEPKREVLARAEKLAGPDAILTTNTSSLPLSALAEALGRPERFAGLHFLNPPELVELVEVVGAERTASRGPRRSRRLDGGAREGTDRRPPRRSRLRRQPAPVRPPARGLRAGRRRRLLLRGRRPRGEPRPRRPLGGDRPVRDDGPRRTRRPRGGRGEPLARARERDRAVAVDRTRARDRARSG